MRKRRPSWRAMTHQAYLEAPPTKPVCRKGKRNLYCVAYDNCLDMAIKNNWTTFSCSASCVFLNTYDPPDVLANNPDHWELYDFYLW